MIQCFIISNKDSRATITTKKLDRGLMKASKVIHLVAVFSTNLLGSGLKDKFNAGKTNPSKF